ncbi:MAG: hypothetical protein AMXMBFR84_29280 [Candidatus Hydrogenedentota bacterium]
MEDRERCACGAIYDVKVDNLKDDLRDLKDRVQRVETTLARGVMLLVANLTGMVISLAQQVFG